jgi:hypothetical protein
MVWPSLQAACDGRIGPEVLLHRTPTGILDRGAALDNPGDRRGPSISRLSEGVSHERARCRRGVPLIERAPVICAYGAIASECEISSRCGQTTYMRVVERRQGERRGLFPGERAEIATLNNEIG